ncbi:hypothetical protein ACFL2V_10970 [Pseudomonadota bacterium]
MKFKNAIKKIAALGTGMTMVGATMMGALAADLSEFPGNMMSDNAFNAVLVVGSTAAPIDIVGAIDLAFSLQASATDVEEISIEGTTEYTVSEGVEIVSSGNHLNLFEEMDDVEDKFTKNDLPVLLADGVVTDDSDNDDYNFVQELYTSDDHIQFDQNDDVDADDPKLYIDLTDDAYILKVDFKTAVNIPDLDDSETISMFGRIFTVSPDNVVASTELTLYASEKTEIIKVLEKKTITLDDGTTLEIECTDANSDDDYATLVINGKLEKAEEGETITVGGTSIYINKVFTGNIPAPTALVEFFVGSDKLELTVDDDWDVVEVDGDDLDGYYAKLDIDDLTNNLDTIEFKFVPSELDDDTIQYLAAGETILDPLFKSFEFTFAGPEPDLMSDEKTHIGFDRSGDKIDLTFTNRDGDEYTFPLFDSNGDSDVEFEEDWAGLANIVVAANDNLTRDTYFILEEGSEISKVYQFKTVRSEDGTEYAEVKDLFDNSVLKLYDGDDVGDSTATVTIESDTDNLISLDEATKNRLLVQYKGTLTITDGQVVFLEGVDGFEDSSDEDLVTDFTVALGGDNGDEGITIDSVTIGGTDGVNGTSADDEEGDWEYGISAYGTYYVLEQKDNGASLDFYYPENQVEYPVFFTPVGAELSTSGGGSTVESTVVNPINVGAAKLDTEVSLAAQNVISIGGPCVNKISSEIMGSPAVCSEGFTEGQAIIKLVENGDKLALMVAGWSGDDTRRATTVLAKYDEYAAQLVGTEVVVTGTTLSDITVSPAAVE